MKFLPAVLLSLALGLFLALPLRAETVLSKYLSEVPADALVSVVRRRAPRV